MPKLCILGTPPAALTRALGGNSASFDDAEAVLVSCASLADIRHELSVRPVTGKVVIVHAGAARLRPLDSQEVDLEVVQKGGRFAELEAFAPKDAGGKLQILVGCLREQVYELVTSIVRAGEADVIYTGIAGSASGIRLGLSHIAASDVLGFALSVALCKQNGVPLEKFMIILRQSALYSPAYEDCLAIESSSKALEPCSTPDLGVPCRVQDSRKEVASICDQATPMSLDMSLAKTVRDAYDKCPPQAHLMSIFSNICPTKLATTNLPGSKSEEVVIVDETNIVVGHATRQEMRRKNLLHQATYVFVINSEGKFFVTKRTPTKDIYPSHFEIAAGGVVARGETVESCAYRELEEELGVSGVSLAPLFDFLLKNDKCQVWGSVYSCVWDGQIRLQPEEVESGRWMTTDEILALSQTEPFTPDGMMALMKYLEHIREAKEGRSKDLSISVLGVGLMGAPIAERLHKCGWKVTAYNRTVERASNLQKAGVPVLGNAADAVAQSQVIITVLSDAQAIRSVILHPGVDLKGKTIIQMGTIGPSQSIALGQDCLKAGAQEYLEAPVLGSIPEAKVGTLLVMVGSTLHAFNRLKHMFEDLDKSPMHVGPPGTAAALKLALNQMIAAETFTFSQSLGFTEWLDIDAKDFVSIVRQSGFYAPTFEKKLDKMLARSFANPNFPLRHLLKDVRLFKEEASKFGLQDLNYLATMERLLERGMEAGYADLDYSALYMIVAFVKPLSL